MNKGHSPAFSVRWVYQQVKVKKHGNMVMEAGQKPCLCFRGRKHALCIAAGYPVRILKRTVEQFDKYRLVMNTPPLTDGKPVKIGEPVPGQTVYDIEQAVRVFEALAQKNGITAGARKLLDRAALQQNGINEDEFEDEEDKETEMENGETETTTPETSGKETTVSAKKTSKKAGKAKASKKAKTPKAPKGPSRISRAVEYMREEVKKAGGQKNLEHGFRKELFAKAAKKFDLSPATCSIQYNKQVLNK